eukprot:129724_1
MYFHSVIDRFCGIYQQVTSTFKIHVFMKTAISVIFKSFCSAKYWFDSVPTDVFDDEQCYFNMCHCSKESNQIHCNIYAYSLRNNWFNNVKISMKRNEKSIQK